MKPTKSTPKKLPEPKEKEPLTKDGFLKFLKQVTRPIPKSSHGSEKKETSG